MGIVKYRPSRPSRIGRFPARLPRLITKSLVLGVLALLSMGVLPASATATVSPFLAQFASEGSGAGQLGDPTGIAADPTKGGHSSSGHVYVVEGGPFLSNHRVNEFTPWGDFVKSWGWGVADGSNELQTCTTTCFKGLAGSGAGQLNAPNGVAVDSNGDVYVFEKENLRVQKFDSEGHFLLMFGGEVNKTTNADICTKAQLESGDVCGAGVPGTGPGQFGVENVSGAFGSYIAVGPGDIVYVGDKDRIQSFESDGTYKAQFPLPESGNPGALASDPTSGDLYFAFAQQPGLELTSKQPNVYRLSSSGDQRQVLKVKVPIALATDRDGNVYVVENRRVRLGEGREVLEFGSSGNQIASCCVPDLAPGNAGANGNRFETPALAVNGVGDLYVVNTIQKVDTYIRAFGPPPLEIAAPPAVPPTIGAQYAKSVDDNGATVGAEINPHFWADTTFYVQYGTSDCIGGGCREQPAQPGSELGAGQISDFIKSRGVFLPELSPNTEYHYRFVAQSSGGGPVFGPDRTFTTFGPSQLEEDCPNQSLRIGASAVLSDCRAYEMVSPLDKNNGDILSRSSLLAYPTALSQSSADGEKFTYSSYRAFDDPLGGPYTSQYMATRQAGSGWSTSAISPPRRGKSSNEDGALVLESEFKAFSRDLASGWLLYNSDPPLDSAAPAGYPGFYSRDNVSGSYRALSHVKPPNISPKLFTPDLLGVSTDGNHAVFRINDALTPDAPYLGTRKTMVYESYDGGNLRLVSVLPDGTASTASSSAGTANRSIGHVYQSVSHAISDDGSRIFWTAAANEETGPGRLYVRIDGEQTLEVSKKAWTDAKFQTASSDGSKVIFTANGGNLYEYNVDSEGPPKLIAHDLIGDAESRTLIGASDDAERLYFLSSEAADKAPAEKAGRPNLYFSNGGVVRYITTLSAADADPGSPLYTPGSMFPVTHTAQASPDGQRLAFTSNASLTAYENIDANTGKADTEVFLYDATANDGEGELRCVSCNPSGARPAGREAQMPANGGLQPIAATVPPFANQLHQPRYLSEDGQRLFFNSYDSLVLADTNGRKDVYEWEAEGAGTCEVQSSAFVPSSGGCISLISSGRSPGDSELLEISPDGHDVFFTTFSSLVSQDYGLIDVYDARIGGGFPPPPNAPAACEGEACQGALVPPDDPTPASSAFEGSGNVVEKRPKMKKKSHKTKRGKKHRHAKHNRRVGR